MYLRGIREEVAREAKAQAAREGLTLSAFVERALERQSRQPGHPTPRLSEIADDMAWFEANKVELLERYAGRVLAIVDGEVVDEDEDVDALARRVAARYDSRSVYMPRCEAETRVVEVPSPTVVR